MKTSTIFTLLILVLMTTTAMADKGKKGKFIYDGYVITIKNDTIFGQVQFVNPTYNELKVRFYQEGKKRIYQPTELSGYAFKINKFNKITKKRVDHWIHYVRKRVQKSPVRQGTKDVFVERQVYGEISLYNFYTLKSSKINNRNYHHVYYVEKEGVGGFGMTRIDRKNYRDTVREFIASNNEELYNKLGTLGFGYKYLASIVKLQNAWLSGEDVTPIYLSMEKESNEHKYADIQ